MKKYAFLLIFAVCAASVFSQDEEEPAVPRLKTVELYAGFSQGLLLSGMQRDLAHDSLSPTPTQFEYISINAGLRVFPAENFGFEGSGEAGFTLVNSAASRSALTTYYQTVFSVGPVVRWSYPLSESSQLGVRLGVGGNYSSLQYTDEYKDLFYGVGSFYEVSPGMGYYARAGLALYPNAPFCFGGDLEYRNLHTSIPATRSNMDGTFLTATLWAGLALQ